MTYDCPTCDRTFETVRGLNCHHGKTHGGPRPRNYDRVDEVLVELYETQDHTFKETYRKQQEILDPVDRLPEDQVKKRLTELGIYDTHYQRVKALSEMDASDLGLSSTPEGDDSWRERERKSRAD